MIKSADWLETDAMNLRTKCHYYWILTRSIYSGKMVVMIIAMALCISIVLYAGPSATITGTDRMMRSACDRIQPHSIFQMNSAFSWNSTAVGDTLSTIDTSQVNTIEPIIEIAAAAKNGNDSLICEMIGIYNISDTMVFDSSAIYPSRLQENQTLIDIAFRDSFEVNDTIEVLLDSDTHTAISINLTIAGYVGNSRYIHPLDTIATTQNAPGKTPITLYFNWTSFNSILEKKQIRHATLILVNFRNDSFQYANIELFLQSITRAQQKLTTISNETQIGLRYGYLYSYVKNAQDEFLSVYYKSIILWFLLLVSSWCILASLMDLMSKTIIHTTNILQTHGVPANHIRTALYVTSSILAFSVSFTFLLSLVLLFQQLPIVLSSAGMDIIPSLIIMVPLITMALVLIAFRRRIWNPYFGSVKSTPSPTKSHTTQRLTPLGRNVIFMLIIGCYFVIMGLLNISGMEFLKGFMAPNILTFIILLPLGIFESALPFIGPILLPVSMAEILFARREVLSRNLSLITKRILSSFSWLGQKGVTGPKTHMTRVGLFIVLLLSMSIVTIGSSISIMDQYSRASKFYVGCDIAILPARNHNITQIIQDIEGLSGVDSVTLEYWSFATVSGFQSDLPLTIFFVAINISEWTRTAYYEGIIPDKKTMDLLQTLDSNSIIITNEQSKLLNADIHSKLNISFSDSQTKQVEIAGILNSSVSAMTSYANHAIISMNSLNASLSENMAPRILVRMFPSANVSNLESTISQMNGIEKMILAESDVLPVMINIYYSTLIQLYQLVFAFLFAITSLLIVVSGYYSIQSRGAEAASLSKKGISSDKIASFIGQGLIAWFSLFCIIGIIIGIISYFAEVSLVSVNLNEPIGGRAILESHIVCTMIAYLAIGALSIYFISKYLAKQSEKWRVQIYYANN